MVGLALVTAGCVERLHVEELGTEERAAAANVGFYDYLPPSAYESLGPIEAISCQATVFDPPPSRAEVLNLLRVKAARLGGEGITQLLCSARGSTFVPACSRSITCAATAIKAPTNAPVASAGGGSGSGFFVNAQGDLVTNAHVTRGCSKVTVRSGEVSGNGDVAYQDPRTDLALVRTGRPAPAFLKLRVAPAMQLAEAVVAIGYPLGSVLSSQVHVTDGSVSALAGARDDTARLQFTAPIQPGNSGGPLVDAAGNLVGVNAQSLVSRDVQNVNFAVKAATVITFLDSVHVPYQTATSGASLSKTEVAARAARATVKLICDPAASPSS